MNNLKCILSYGNEMTSGIFSGKEISSWVNIIMGQHYHGFELNHYYFA
jgi:hypothetical protein